MSSPTTFFRISLGLAFLVTSGLSQIVVPTSSAIAQNVNSLNATTQTTEPLKLAQANVVLFVAPNGADTNSGISADQPLRSLTAALKKNPQAGAVIQVSSGNYTPETGEVFPIKIPAGVTLRGNAKTLSFQAAESLSAPLLLVKISPYWLVMAHALRGSLSPTLILEAMPFG